MFGMPIGLGATICRIAKHGMRFHNQFECWKKTDNLGTNVSVRKLGLLLIF